MHSFKNLSVQGPDYIQTWAQDFHCRLAVPTQAWGGERQAHQRYGYKNRHHTRCDRHPRMHLYITNPASISAGWTPTMSKKHDIYSLARHKGWTSQWLKTILVLQRWPASNRWSSHEGQAHNHTSSSKTTSVGSTPSKSHGYKKNKATHVQICILGQY